jgi:DNA repair exonuclease SbcCD ATPase subunit
VSTISFYINKIQKEIVGLQSQESVDNSDIDGLELNKRNLTKYEKEKESLLIEKSTLDIASVILKDGGIKSKIIKQYIPIINKLINKYLAQMDFDVNFNLDENFNETIKSRFRDEFSYESFSEGEKSRIDVSLLFAWRAISKLRNSNSTNILILDEIGDSSLDTSGSDEFIRILQELAGTTNIIMISHRVDGKQDTFDRVIEFVNEKNFTRIIQ